VIRVLEDAEGLAGYDSTSPVLMSKGGMQFGNDPIQYPKSSDPPEEPPQRGPSGSNWSPLVTDIGLIARPRRRREPTP